MQHYTRLRILTQAGDNAVKVGEDALQSFDRATSNTLHDSSSGLFRSGYNNQIVIVQ